MSKKKDLRKSLKFNFRWKFNIENIFSIYQIYKLENYLYKYTNVINIIIYVYIIYKFVLK